MTNFINKLWTRINCEKPAFSDADFAQFYTDFSEMIDDFWYVYKSNQLSDLKRLAQNNVDLFEKMADILQYQPNFFASKDIQEWLFWVFETERMPRAGTFALFLNWNAESVAPLAASYIQDPQMRMWIAQHWNDCQKFRFPILFALRRNHIFDNNLFQKYNPHFLRQFTIAVILFCGLTWCYFNNYIQLLLFGLLGAVLGYWILLELFFTVLCQKIKAFW